MNYESLLDSFFKDYGCNATINNHKINGVFFTDDKNSQTKSNDDSRLGINFDEDFIFLTTNNPIVMQYEKIFIKSQDYIITNIKSYFLGDYVLYLICNLEKC